jgi:hypothetical protein
VSGVPGTLRQTHLCAVLDAEVAVTRAGRRARLDCVRGAKRGHLVADCARAALIRPAADAVVRPCAVDCLRAIVDLERARIVDGEQPRATARLCGVAAAPDIARTVWLDGGAVRELRAAVALTRVLKAALRMCRCRLTHLVPVLDSGDGIAGVRARADAALDGRA